MSTSMGFKSLFSRPCPFVWMDLNRPPGVGLERDGETEVAVGLVGMGSGSCYYLLGQQAKTRRAAPTEYESYTMDAISAARQQLLYLVLPRTAAVARD
jgi:hypothetical protein